jgi:hypothetical protein
MSQHFGKKFWMNIVIEAGTETRQLHLAQNPAIHFQEREGIFTTGIISKERK